MKTTPGIFLYKPMPFSYPDEFYRPKYAVMKKRDLPDLRSTIHWMPNILTNISGKARVSFYSADLKGQYTLILEGTDMNGRIGFKKGRIEIRE